MKATTPFTAYDGNVSLWLTLYLTSCLITIYLSEWGLSRVLSAQRLPLIIHRQTDIISTAE